MIVMKSMLIPALLAVGFASHAQNNTMQLASKHKQLKQMSIAASNEEMKTTIDNFLNQQYD